MTVLAADEDAGPAACPAEAGGECARLLKDDILAAMGWYAGRRVLAPAAGNLLFGRGQCPVAGCGHVRVTRTGLCGTCGKRWKLQSGGVSFEEFVLIPRAGRSVGVDDCAVPGCPRPWKSRPSQLCSTHDMQRVKIFRLPLDEFISHPGVVPLPSFGPCEVASCTRARPGSSSYCRRHRLRFREARRRDRGLDERAWRAAEPSVPEENTVSLRGLPPRLVSEILYGVQARIAEGTKTKIPVLRTVCDRLRAAGAASVLDHEADPGGARNLPDELLRSIRKHVRRTGLDVETEVAKDAWDMWVFGRGGTLEFTRISQPWLKSAAKRWAADDVTRRRGRLVTSMLQGRVRHLERLSQSLRAHRLDRGEEPSALGRADIEAFLHRLAFQESAGEITPYTRRKSCEELRFLLDRMKSLGLSRPGQPMVGLPHDFCLMREDIPAAPDDSEAGRDIPAGILQQLCDRLPALEDKSAAARAAVEILIDTGRRPDEVCQLRWDCLGQDPDGKHVLIYDNSKANREKRRLPIPDATGAVISRQKRAVRARYPDAELARLRLFPSPMSNPHGRRAISAGWLGEMHREWVRDMPSLAAHPGPDAVQDASSAEFDKARLTPYAYRHTYAQRHADAGVPIDVLRELMDHDAYDTTQGYYNPRELHQMSEKPQVAC